MAKNTVARRLIIAAIATGAVFTSPTPVGAQQVVEILEALVTAVGVSGREEQVRARILERLPAWARSVATVDAMGNLIVTIGSGEPHVAYIAHMDEIGYMVTNIRDDGLIQVAKHGGFFDRQYEGQLIEVHTLNGAVPGVVAIRSVHLWRGLDAPPGDFDHADVLIDVGTRSREQTKSLGIELLDPITVPKRFTRLAGTRMSARSMDDRFGCAAQIAVAQRIQPRDISGTLTLAWVVQEEVGLRGSTAVAKDLEPDVVVPIDSYVTSDSALEDPRVGYHELGAGPVVRALDTSHIAPIDLIRALMNFAEAADLRLSYGATQGGNDGSVFRNGRTRVLPLAIPIRYSHTAIEMIDSRDLEELVDLLAAMVQDTSWTR